MGQLGQIEPRILEAGYQIIAVSADKPEKLRETMVKLKLNYTLLSDSDAAGARALGLAYRVDEKTFAFLKDKGLDIEDASGNRNHVLPVPAVFLVGKDARVRFEYVNPDHKIRLNPGILLAAIEAER